MADEPASMGFSGNVAKRFLTTEITPLLALVGFLLGVFAVMVTPREEEPQINVTFANVFIAFPGAGPAEVESLIAGPAEQVLSEIEGIKHVYSTSMPGMCATSEPVAMTTALPSTTCFSPLMNVTSTLPVPKMRPVP